MQVYMYVCIIVIEHTLLGIVIHEALCSIHKTCCFVLHMHWLCIQVTICMSVFMYVCFCTWLHLMA